MGMDIHLHLVKNGEIIKKDIFDGRNSEWFMNIQGDGWDEVYNTFPMKYGISNQAPAEFDERKLKEDYYFGFYHISVKDFKEWFIKYRPDIDAGWVTTYDKWKIEKRGYIPEEIYHYLPEDANINDMHFVEIPNRYDCSKWLYNYIIENNIDDDADITYWFDN